jgi:gamma-glutamylaminecyclotransferase
MVRAHVAEPAGARPTNTGELCELDEELLARIDPLESLGRSGNLRILLRVESVSGSGTRDAFVYAKAPELATPVNSGYLDTYRDRRFIPPWQRHVR